MDLNKAAEELYKSGRADKLKGLADSEEAKRLTDMLDKEKVERAAMSGDGAALRDILRQVLTTDEGKRLAGRISDAMK